jgi:putative DNA primase/helicase
MLDIRTIARTLGGDVTGRDQCIAPGPGHSQNDRSLSIGIRPNGGFLVFSHAGDDWKACLSYIRTKLGWADDNKHAHDPIGDDHVVDQEHRKKFALKIWNEAIDPRGTLVEKYLREYRGLTLPDSVANSAIRFHAGLRYKTDSDPIGKYLPCMVCLMRNVKTDEPTAIHRTFLDRYTGKKIDRRMLGVAKGAAIKLDPEPSAKLTIGEGVETTLAAREAGFTPGWASGSAYAVGPFPILRRVRELTLLLENDPTSEKFVRVCVNRYRDAGRTAHVVVSQVGSDFNDAWKAMHHGY